MRPARRDLGFARSDRRVVPGAGPYPHVGDLLGGTRASGGKTGIAKLASRGPGLLLEGVSRAHLQPRAETSRGRAQGQLLRAPGPRDLTLTRRGTTRAAGARPRQSRATVRQLRVVGQLPSLRLARRTKRRIGVDLPPFGVQLRGATGHRRGAYGALTGLTLPASDGVTKPIEYSRLACGWAVRGPLARGVSSVRGRRSSGRGRFSRGVRCG